MSVEVVRFYRHVAAVNVIAQYASRAPDGRLRGSDSFSSMFVKVLGLPIGTPLRYVNGWVGVSYSSG